MTLADRIIRISERRSPDFIIGGADAPYLRRWWIIPRNRWFNIYLHEFLRSDDDRALHDHPWFNLSILLRGEYLEITPSRAKVRWPGAVVFRSPWARHRIALFRSTANRPHPCWTLFITGPRLRNWGFHCPRGFVPWQDFTAPGAKGEIGKGCGD